MKLALQETQDHVDPQDQLVPLEILDNLEHLVKQDLMGLLVSQGLRVTEVSREPRDFQELREFLVNLDL